MTDKKPKRPQTGRKGEETSPPQRFEDLQQEIERQVGPLIQGEARDQVISRLIPIVREEVYRGPLPHPRHLQAYEDIFVGASERVIAMGEKSLGA